jgi:hypothetical protein
MSRTLGKLRRSLPIVGGLVVFGVAVVISLDFWAHDICADAGGVYLYSGFECWSARIGYLPLASRPLSLSVLRDGEDGRLMATPKNAPVHTISSR